MQAITIIKIELLQPHPKNPRFIRDEKFQALVKSLRDFPEMLGIRPIVCYSDTRDGAECFTVIGGNMRLRAAQEIGLEEIPCMIVNNLTELQREEFLIKDNINFGEWDRQQLIEWPKEKLDDWGGVELPSFSFTPTLEPGSSDINVSQNKIDKASDELRDQFKKERPKYKVTCPNCADEFEIDK